MGWIVRFRVVAGGVESRWVQRGNILHQRRKGVDRVVDGYGEVGHYLLTGSGSVGGRWMEVDVLDDEKLNGIGGCNP
jgi:hypothetical protein